MYNDFEKTFITEIIEKKYTTVADIIFNKYDFKIVKNNFANYCGGALESINVGSDVYLITEKEENDVFNYIAQINACLEKLKEKGYISIQDVPSTTKCLPFLVKKSQATGPSAGTQITLQIRGAITRKLFYGQDLTILVSNNFKTPTELAEERNEKIATRSLTVSVWAIIAPIIMTIITTIFSYCTYTKDRYVTIKEPITIQMNQNDKINIKVEQSESIPVDVQNSIIIEKIDSGEIPIIIKVIHEYPLDNKNNNEVTE